MNGLESIVSGFRPQCRRSEVTSPFGPAADPGLLGSGSHFQGKHVDALPEAPKPGRPSCTRYFGRKGMDYQTEMAKAPSKAQA